MNSRDKRYEGLRVAIRNALNQIQSQHLRLGKVERVVKGQDDPDPSVSNPAPFIPKPARRPR
jgi:hypothetical protein